MVRLASALLHRPVVEPADPQLGPVGQTVEHILTEAVERRASDLHVDPCEGGTRLRLRIDGHFEETLALPAAQHEKIVARIKVLAGLTVYRREEVQEGSIRRESGVDLRVSILPTIAGEKVTVRVFDPSTRPFLLADLGFAPETVAVLARLADARQGAVLVCGPAGSGKTTTLYALLRRIQECRGDFTNLCSIEDPVEFALDGVHQVPVRRERGLTFSRGLSALLRQDPQVILVGEIRDGETAGIAVEAGMTGHLVLSSVHAGRAAECVTRLLDLGVEPYLVTTSLKAVVAQRLLRRVCQRCAQPDPSAAELVDRFEIDAPGSWRRGTGCDHCRGTGYAGRFPVGEILEIDRATAARVVAREDAAALSCGLSFGRSLLDEAIDRARRGETTLEEVARTVDLAEGHR